MNAPAEIARILRQADRLALFSHARPDGDTLGSAAALCLALRSLGKTADLYCTDEIPARFLFLPVMKEFRRAPQEQYDVYVALDCADAARLGDNEVLFCRQRVTVNVDHHISNTRYAKYNYVAGEASNCENVHGLLGLLNAALTPEIANALLLGISTDTANFNHKNVTEHTLKTAAALVGAGADLNAVSYQMFRRQSKERARLFGTVMSRIRYFLGDRLAIATVMMKDVAESGAGKDETEGFIDFVMGIDTVEVGICMMETAPRTFKVSFRSRKTDVNAVASVFGGGGHVLASGCMIHGYYEDAVDRLVSAVSRYLEE